MTTTEITTAEMVARGEQHARDGKTCTPFDCREIDAEIFAAMKEQDRPARWYAEMRGAFNKGWEAAYFAL